MTINVQSISLDKAATALEVSGAKNVWEAAGMKITELRDFAGPRVVLVQGVESEVLKITFHR